MARFGRAHIGCSGWEYDPWRGDFYPRHLPKRLWFAHYAGVFDTLEVNGTFYKLPERSTFADWAARAPRGFRFAIKASRYLTHLKKLKAPEEPLARLFDRMAPLGVHQGPVLYQLPPGWAPNLERLEHFLQCLPKGFRHVVEFREPGWYSDEVFALLRRHGVTLCLHDLPGSVPPRVQLGPITYVRFHGTTKPYHGAYGARRLAGWADWLHARRLEGRDVWAAFNNDIGGHAPRDALLLRRLLEERT